MASIGQTLANYWDVIVVGGGNAGFCAAHAARELVPRVLILEKAPIEWAGGNSYFTAGAMRVAHNGLAELRELVPDLTPEQLATTDIPAYPDSAFLNDMFRVTEGRTRPDLAALIVGESLAAAKWLQSKGIRWRLQYDRQSFLVDGRHQFWGNLPLGVQGGGVSLMEQHLAAAEASGIQIAYDSGVVGFIQRPGGPIQGVVVDNPQGRQELRAGAAVLAAGGFEADPRLRAMYLGPGWDIAKVRGTPYNTGEVLQLALEAGADPYGQWSGSHAIQWDAAAPEHGDREITNLFSKQSYPVSIVVNRDGRRFIDEGADYRNYTYAKYGAEVLKQPGAIAWQLYDAKTTPLLRQDEYTVRGVSKIEANTIRELALATGINPDGLERTVDAYNLAIQPGDFNPAVKDGKHTEGIEPPKSNWALPLDTPPYLAFAVTCGVTFTFGGLRIDTAGAVRHRSGSALPGLFAAGEIVGGVFYHNYPGGSGLTNGAVIGRRAGTSAARSAMERVTHQADD